MATFIIKIEADDQSDLDFIRDRAMGAVQLVVEDNQERFDSEVTVDWEWGED